MSAGGAVTFAGGALAFARNAQSASLPTLPPPLRRALARAGVPSSALSCFIAPVADTQPPLLAHRISAPMNPASVMKLVTTYCALETFGPQWHWQTPVFLGGEVVGETLSAPLYIQGAGDPKLVIERLWLLLRRVRALGVRHLAGGIVLDHSLFAFEQSEPAGSFDGQSERSYNAAPDALLINFRSALLTFTPLPSSNSARIDLQPPLQGFTVPQSVPLLPGRGCPDFKRALRANLTRADGVRFAGAYPAGCGEKTLPFAPALNSDESFAARAVAALWEEMGGTFGTAGAEVRSGLVPEGLEPTFVFLSPPLASVLRDINKYSNNVMARQLFRTLGAHWAQLQGLPRAGSGSDANARQAIAAWWQQRFTTKPPAIRNGAGLSRTDHISALDLASLLRAAHSGVFMPEWMSSLPSWAQDGTLAHLPEHSAGQSLKGRAHLKTGSLRDVAALAGYVLGQSGRRYVFVALLNHAHAHRALPVLHQLALWTMQDGGKNPAVETQEDWSSLAEDSAAGEEEGFTPAD